MVFWVSLLLMLGEPFCALKDQLQSRYLPECALLGSQGLYGVRGALHGHSKPFPSLQKPYAWRNPCLRPLNGLCDGTGATASHQ